MNNRELDDLVERLKQTACGGTHWNEMLLSASHAICVLRQESNQLCDQLAAARAELAAAQVRLEVVAEWVAALHELRKEQPAEFGAWWWDEAFKRIDAALAGEKK